MLNLKSQLKRSIEEADYSFVPNNPKWDLILHIRIDVGGGKEVITPSRYES